MENAKNPPRSKLHVWDWPDAPNERIHVDFLGPLENDMYIVITDAFSKWVDIREMKRIDANSTITVLRDYCSSWGLPKKLVSDNGPAFRSEEFAKFLRENGIRHIKTAPYHPASNGAAENAVKTFKSKFKLIRQRYRDKHEALAKYLFNYRSIPHCTTGISPAELQIGRKFRNRFDLLKLQVKDKVKVQQDNQKKFYHGNRQTEFQINDVVRAYDGHSKWHKAIVTEKLGDVTYNVVTDNNVLWKRHTNQIISSNESIDNNEIQKENEQNKINNACNKPCIIDSNITGEENNEKLLSKDTNEIKKDICEKVVINDIIKNKKESKNVNNKIIEPVRRSNRTPKPRKVTDYDNL